MHNFGFKRSRVTSTHILASLPISVRSICFLDFQVDYFEEVSTPGIVHSIVYKYLPKSSPKLLTLTTVYWPTSRISTEIRVFHPGNTGWTKKFVRISSIPWVLHAPVHLILLDFITLIIFDEHTNYEASHYAIVPILLLLSLSWVQIFSSAPCSQTPPTVLFPRSYRPSITSIQKIDRTHSSNLICS